MNEPDQQPDATPAGDAPFIGESKDAPPEPHPKGASSGEPGSVAAWLAANPLLEKGKASDVTGDLASTTAETAADTKADKPPKEKGRWRRRILRTLVVVVLLALVIRVVIGLAFRTVLAKVAAYYGFDCNYERVEMQLVSGDVGIWHLKLTPVGGGEPLMQAEYVRGNIVPLKLLTGVLEVWRVEADGMDLNVDRDAAGRFPALDAILAKVAGAPKAPEKPKGGPRQIDLSAPLRVDAFRLQHVRVRLRDQSVSPPFEGTVIVNVRVSDLGSKVRPIRFGVEVSSDPMLDGLLIEGEGRSAGAALDARMSVRVRGLHLKPAAGYLEPLGIRPVANEIAMRMDAHLVTAAAGSPTTRPRADAAVPTSRPVSPAVTGGDGVVAAGAAKPVDALAAALVLENIAILADGKEAMGVDRLALDAGRITLDAAGTTQLASLLINGVRGNARRTPTGSLQVAGVELLPSLAPPAVPSTRPASQPIEPAIADVTATGAPPPAVTPSKPISAPPMLPVRVTLGLFSLRDVRLALTDQSVSPVTELAFHVDELSAKDVILDPDRPDAPMVIAGSFRAPGIARSVQLDATVLPFAQQRTVDLSFKVEGVAPAILRPYLDMVGLESLLKDGSIAGTLKAALAVGADGRIGAEAAVGRITFGDAGTELLTLDGVRLDGISLDPSDGSLRAALVEVTGPKLAFRRDASGAIEAFGFRTKTPTTRPAPAESGGGLPLAKVEVGKFVWKDIRARFDDDAASPPAAVDLADAGVELNDLHLDFTSDNAGARPCRLKAWLAAPNLAERLTAEGTLTPRPRAIAMDVRVAGTRVTASGIAPYLKSFGIEPVLKDGAFAAHAQATLGRPPEGDRLVASLDVDGVTYTDGPTELAGVDKLHVGDVVLAGKRLTIGAVEIDRPRARAERDADGSLLVGGIRLRTPTPPDEPKPTAVALVPKDGPTTVPATAPGTPAGPSFTVELKRLRVQDGSIAWVDRALSPTLDLGANADLTVTNLNVGASNGPASVALTARVPGIMDSMTVLGTFSPDPAAPAATLDVSAQGLKAGPLAAYLPPGVEISLRDGRFKTSVDVAAEMNPAGGRRARFVVNGLDYHDGAGGASLFKLDTVRVVASRIDPAGGAIAIDEVSVGGIEADTNRAADGSKHLFGIALKSAPAPTTAPSGAPEAGAAPAPAVATRGPATAPTSAPAPDVATIVARARRPAPLVTLDKLDINVRRLAFIDLARPASVPATLRDVQLSNAARIEMLGPDAQNRPPADIRLTGRLDPLIDRFAVVSLINPFAAEPTLQADAEVSGFRGQGLSDLVPELREKVDGGQLTDGRFKTHVEMQAKLDRRTPTDFDLSRGFALDLGVRDTEFRASPDGPVLASLEELRVEGARVRPADSTVRIKSLELTKPMGRFHRASDGVHAFGWVIKLPPKGPTTAPSTGPTEPAPVEVAAAPAAPSPATAPARPAGEVRIDKLTISGLDVLVEDRTTTPPMVVPLNAFDLDARGLSSLALYEDRPMRFNLSVGSAKVPLPKKLKGGIGGALGDAAALLGGQVLEARPEFEDRELFAQVAASGALSLYPEARGWVKSSVSGLELAGFAGPAKEQGVTLSYGTFDGDVDVRFDAGAMDAKTKLVLTDLSVSEPADGPIFRFIKPPVPLDTAIGMLEAAEKSITLPLHVPVERGKVSTGAVAASASGAILQVITVAVASAPVKVVTGVAELVGLPGLGGGDKPKAPEEPVLLAFAPGATGLEEPERRRIAALVERMRTDPGLEVSLKHDLGGGDLRIASARANPPIGDASAIAARLRARKLELTRLRGETAGRTRAALALSSPADAAAAVERLRDVDRELASTEDALDKVYDLLRPGAERQGGRRARAAALDIARERLEVTRAAIVTGGVPGIEKRVKVMTAQFTPADDAAGGRIAIGLVHTKK